MQKKKKKKKKKILAFSFQLCSTANSFYISFCEINLIKIQAMSLVLNPFYERLFVLFTLRHHSPATEEKVRAAVVELFFQSRKRNKNLVLCKK